MLLVPALAVIGVLASVDPLVAHVFQWGAIGKKWQIDGSETQGGLPFKTADAVRAISELLTTGKQPERVLIGLRQLAIDVDATPSLENHPLVIKALEGTVFVIDGVVQGLTRSAVEYVSEFFEKVEQLPLVSRVEARRRLSDLGVFINHVATLGSPKQQLNFYPEPLVALDMSLIFLFYAVGSLQVAELTRLGEPLGSSLKALVGLVRRADKLHLVTKKNPAFKKNSFDWLLGSADFMAVVDLLDGQRNHQVRDLTDWGVAKNADAFMDLLEYITHDLTLVDATKGRLLLHVSDVGLFSGSDDLISLARLVVKWRDALAVLLEDWSDHRTLLLDALRAECYRASTNLFRRIEKLVAEFTSVRDPLRLFFPSFLGKLNSTAPKFDWVLRGDPELRVYGALVLLELTRAEKTLAEAVSGVSEVREALQILQPLFVSRSS